MPSRLQRTVGWVGLVVLVINVLALYWIAKSCYDASTSPSIGSTAGSQNSPGASPLARMAQSSTPTPEVKTAPVQDPDTMTEANNAGAGKPAGAGPSPRAKDGGNQQDIAWKPAAAVSGRPFKFHIYQIPERYIDGALKELELRWAGSYCNRHKVKTNYTMLDWRHAHSLFTVDVFIAKYLKHHPQHTMDPKEADAFIIPMMTHVYNCAGLHTYMAEVLGWVTKQPYYKVYNQHDHWMFWWRWGMHYNTVLKFWKKAQSWIPNVNLISFDLLEIMGRNEYQDFSLALKPKFRQNLLNIVVPYPDYSPPLRRDKLQAESAIHNKRDIFFFFAGTSTIGGIRRWIKRACESNTEACVYKDFAGSVIDPKRVGVPQDYPTAMKQSLFCGHAQGDALSSRRPTSAVLAGCIPVLICDLCLYAWESSLDYASFAVFVAEQDVMDGKLFSILQAIPEERINEMQKNLFSVREKFIFDPDGPPQQGDAMYQLVSELEQRAMVLRSWQRWWRRHPNLSSREKDYPADPPLKKFYLRANGSSAKEHKDFNNLRG